MQINQLSGRAMNRKNFEQNPKLLPPKKDEPALHCAARLGNHDRIRQLINEGNDINLLFDMALDPGGREAMATPLMVAAGSGYGASVETMRLLLDLGADPTLKYKWGSIGRFATAGLGWNYLPGGDAARLRLCLELGCDPNETDRRGVTLVADAAGTGDVERVRVLLDAGASPNGDRTIVPSSFEPTPNSPFDDTAPYSFRIPLHSAVEADDIESVRLLLAAGADLHALDHGGQTALFGARSTEVVQVLTDAGLNIEAHDFLGWSPLLAAVMDGSLEGVKALLSVGADVNATHDRGFTVFMSAVGAMERNLEIINTLLEAGADPHAITELGWNAFHAAVDVGGAEASSEESVRSTLGRLKELGVNINHKNAQGITPIEMAWGIEVDVLFELGAKRL